MLTIADDEYRLAELTAKRCTNLLSDGLRARGEATLCLAGGSTPRRTYELLASDPWRQQVAWDRVQVYWSDERLVPATHQDSNYRMAWEALLQHVPVSASHVHRVDTEMAPEDAAAAYERELPARLDLVLLGLGADAHVASLFPGSPLLSERDRRVAAIWVPHLHSHRVTFTPAALLASERIVVIVAGGGKAAAVAAALERPTNVGRYPAHILRGAGERVEWFIDRAAAGGHRGASERATPS